MLLNEYIEKVSVSQENKSIVKKMWANNRLELFTDAKIGDSLEDYIKNNYDWIHSKYGLSIPKEKIEVEGVIQELGWFAVVLHGREKSYSFHVDGAKKEHKNIEYYSCFIYGDNILKPENITLDKKVKKLALKIQEIHPTINEFKSNKHLKL